MGSNKLVGRKGSFPQTLFINVDWSIYYSFIFKKINLTNLISMSKIQYTVYSKMRLVGPINKSAAIYAYGLWNHHLGCHETAAA